MIKRTAATVLSLAIVGGAMPFEAGTFDLSRLSLTAEAASKPYTYDSTTKTLHFTNYTKVKTTPHISRYSKRDKEKLPARTPRA